MKLTSDHHLLVFGISTVVAFFFLILLFVCLFCLWLRWVFVAAQAFSLAAVRGGRSPGVVCRPKIIFLISEGLTSTNFQYWRPAKPAHRLWGLMLVALQLFFFYIGLWSIHNGSSSALNYIPHRNASSLRSTEKGERRRKKGGSGKKKETASNLKDTTNRIYSVLSMWVSDESRTQPGQCPLRSLI